MDKTDIDVMTKKQGPGTDGMGLPQTAEPVASDLEMSLDQRRVAYKTRPWGCWTYEAKQMFSLS